MSDDQSSSSGSAATQTTVSPLVIVPPELQEKQPELVELILKSESMNYEERQYWIDILPVMTADQINQLRQILHNERTQLAAIDAKYAEKNATDATSAADTKTQEERKQRRTERAAAEHDARNTEEENAEAILKGME